MPAPDSPAAERAAPVAPALRPPDVSVVVPTRNERENVAPFVAELAQALAGRPWEVIFVDDDSPDGTADAVRALAARDPRVRCLQRVGRRGLSSACVEGMLSSAALLLAVMDGDLQHDPRVLAEMLRLLEESEAEIVVGSRHVEGGGAVGFSRQRTLVSDVAAALGRRLAPAGLRDPMSGYFALRRSLLHEVVRDLSGLGFKILLDIFASARRPVAFREVPYTFRTRVAGQSKLDGHVAWDYLMLLADKAVGRWVPVRFVSFCLIGGLGVAVHVALLAGLHRLTGAGFAPSQAVATVGAMVFNYTLNNLLTYRDRRRRGLAWLGGLATFMLACGVGAVGNVGVAVASFHRHAGWLASGLAGVLVGAVWNYATTAHLTWGDGTRRRRSRRAGSRGGGPPPDAASPGLQEWRGGA